MVRVLREVFIARMIVFLLCIVTLYMVSWMVSRVLVMVDSCILIQVVIV